MRLLEGDVRAASMTSSAPGARCKTQASNFSDFRRSAIPPVMTTVSIPNWRKHSDKTVLAFSLRSTRAARAATFLEGGRGASTEPRALSMGGAVSALKLYSGPLPPAWQRCRSAITEYRSTITRNAPEIARNYLQIYGDWETYSIQRRNSSAPLVPPNPNEFDMA